VNDFQKENSEASSEIPVTSTTPTTPIIMRNISATIAFITKKLILTKIIGRKISSMNCQFFISLTVSRVQPIDLVVAILIGLISVGGIIGHGLILFILFCRPSRKTWTRSMMQLNSIFALSYLIVQTSRDIYTILSGEAQLKTTSWGRFRNCDSRVG
jgi:hypothetical protein